MLTYVVKVVKIVLFRVLNLFWAVFACENSSQAISPHHAKVHGNSPKTNLHYCAYKLVVNVLLRQPHKSASRLSNDFHAFAVFGHLPDEKLVGQLFQPDLLSKQPKAVLVIHHFHHYSSIDSGKSVYVRTKLALLLLVWKRAKIPIPDHIKKWKKMDDSIHFSQWFCQ